MGYELSGQNCVRCKKNDIAESEVPSILRAAEIIVTGESAGGLKMPEDFTMESEFFISAERVYFKIGAVYENFIGKNQI
jgi:hypothetical protein